MRFEMTRELIGIPMLGIITVSKKQLHPGLRGCSYFPFCTCTIVAVNTRSTSQKGDKNHGGTTSRLKFRFGMKNSKFIRREGQ